MKSIRRCEIVSNLKNEDKILFDMDRMKEVLENRHCIQDYCYIIHDRDVYNKQDEAKNPLHKCGEYKAAHIHLLLRFKDNQPQKIGCVANWFNIPENFVNTIKGNWNDACLYQIHRNAPDKFQYPVEDVTCNFDFQKVLDNQNTNLISLIQRILNGEIREYNKTIEIDNLLLVTHAKHFNEAFKVRSEHLQATTKDRNMECIFITGSSGSGKTTLAKKIATEKNLDYFVSSGSNDILDGYMQQPCLILDDIRPSALGLSDLLKMLDNHTSSTIKSRYRNKFLNCELIILTTVLDIDSFYQNVFSEHEEPITQLKRRCGTYIKMDRQNIQISLWDNKALQYTKSVVYQNSILDKYIPESYKTIDDVKAHVSELIPFLELKEERDFESIADMKQLELPFND